MQVNMYSHLPCSLMVIIDELIAANPNGTMTEQRIATHIMGNCPRCSTVAKSLYLESVIDAIRIVDAAKNAAIQAAADTPPLPEPAEIQPTQSHHTAPSPLPDDAYDERWTRELEQDVINNRRPLQE
jgi:hypothetical protein